MRRIYPYPTGARPIPRRLNALVAGDVRGFGEANDETAGDVIDLAAGVSASDEPAVQMTGVQRWIKSFMYTLSISAAVHFVLRWYETRKR